MPLSRNLGALTSWNPLGLSRPVTGLLYFYFTFLLSCLCVFLFSILSRCELNGIIFSLNDERKGSFLIVGAFRNELRPANLINFYLKTFMEIVR